MTRRMRIKRGRVMHLVEERAGWIRSQCRRSKGVKGVTGTEPRANSYAEDWTEERRWYPDCRHCPGSYGSDCAPPRRGPISAGAGPIAHQPDTDFDLTGAPSAPQGGSSGQATGKGR